ncbi:sugar ABC transporter ATP-binding protein [Paenibacillus sp. Soil787]|uniref:sugar ABC transporter ATP-binding protein n=1 Tax=Paenibacillus sp. Soil787 TaxID=1736411 RepID=UPI000702B217|nr:sugar ABC transporter ATP-binding protein [Paenibacillus sp. Soil787]KRF09782.1 D-ribose transporter ATP-binding protein [Paenibacillus sp. Soil787]
MTSKLLEMKGISKSFPGVKVLEQVDFTLHRGEVHALMGENGAGKSTLMKILGGIYTKDSGSITVNGNVYDIASPSMAQNLGIVIIHQELNMVPHLTVMENIFLGREFTYGKSKLINWRRMRQESHRYLSQLGLNIDPGTLVNELSVGQQQMVEIAKALSMQAEILVLDEPTAALTDREIEALFLVIASLKEKGVGMIYISHRMEEIFRICDQVTVMRDGHYIGTEYIANTTMDHLVKMMVGREIKDRFPKVKVTLGEEKLTVGGLTQKGKLHDISLTVRAGEIVGIAGLMGAGRTELAKALFGVTPIDRGTISINGKPVSIHKPIDAIHAGIGLITEDRKDEGLLLPLSVNDNLALPNLKILSSFGFMNRSKERELSDSMIKKLLIKTPNSEQKVGSLSGGNQQKVVIGKWLATSPQVLILDEPTRGVDIGAKKEIYDLMNELVSQGVAILMISSELPEVLGMSDRILVMHEGKISGEFTQEEATQEKIMLSATGGGNRHAG